MSMCSKCCMKIPRHSDALTCANKDCGLIFHRNCVLEDASESFDIDKISSWMCPGCVSCSSTNANKMEVLLKQVAEIHTSISGVNFKEMSSTICSLQDAVASLQSELKVKDQIIESLEKKSEGLGEEVKLLTGRVGELDARVNSLTNKLDESQASNGEALGYNSHSRRLCRSEQYSRNKMLEIRNLREVQQENLRSVVMKVAGKLGVDVKDEEIQAVHRLKKRDDKVPGVIVELSSRPKRDAIVFAKNKVLTNLELTGAGEGKVFIGDSLSPYYRKLLYDVRSRANSLGFEDTWYSKYNICVRKTRGADVIKIASENELDKLN